MKHLFIAIIIILSVISCNDNITNNSNDSTGSLHFSLAKKNVPDNVAIISVILSKSDNEALSRQFDLLNNNSAEVYFNELEVGMWNIRVDAADNDSIVIYSGNQDIEIKEGLITSVYLKLNPVLDDKGGVFIYADWVELSKDWIDENSNPIVTKSSDTYQKFGVHQPFVIYDEGIFKMWYLGSSDNSTSYIFYATSVDGIAWQQYGSTPVIYPGSNGTWDSNHISPGPIIKENGIYKMYYGAWSSQYSNWSIGLATSTDGIQWTKYAQNPILVGTSWDKQLGAAGLVKSGSTYYLYYSGMTNNSYLYSIGLATSTDGINWNKYDFPILTPTQDWEKGSISYPNVIYEDNIFKMVYQGSDNPRKFSIAYSNNGINWTKFFDKPFFTTAESNYGKRNINYPYLLKLQNEYRLYYTGTDYNNNSSICVARKYITK